MNKLASFLMVASLMVFLMSANAFATPFGKDITVWDKNSTDENWHQAGEDEEVEPGMAHGQKWDLEGFFLDGTNLTMAGGFNFKDGEDGSGHWNSGDIFIDVDGDAVYGKVVNSSTASNREVDNTYGYDYVLDMDFYAGTYDVYQIDETAKVRTAYFSQNQGSNPWTYVSGGDLLTTGVISYNQHSSDDAAFLDSYFSGGIHNVVGVDVGFLASMNDLTFHNTMQCGNDNLVGVTTPNTGAATPEPGTVLLLGIGIIGFAGLRRRRRK